MIVVSKYNRLMSLFTTKKFFSALLLLLIINLPGYAGEADDEEWLAMVDNGDKPAIGYSLKIRDGKVTSGKFQIFSSPHDGQYVEQATVPFEQLFVKKDEVKFRVVLNDGDKVIQTDFKLIIDERSDRAKSILATLTALDDGSDPVHLVFKRSK